jgi:hypothetical protein
MRFGAHDDDQHRRVEQANAPMQLPWYGRRSCLPTCARCGAQVQAENAQTCLPTLPFDPSLGVALPASNRRVAILPAARFELLRSLLTSRASPCWPASPFLARGESQFLAEGRVTKVAGASKLGQRHRTSASGNRGWSGHGTRTVPSATTHRTVTNRATYSQLPG